MLNDRNRTAALGIINTVRSLVAQGQFPAFMSSASLMNKLPWNCDLEIVAETAVTGCPPRPHIAPSANGFNYRFIAAGSSIIDLTYPIQRTILEWTNLQAPWPSSNIFDGNPVLLSFANMIRGNTTAVGCSGAICSDRSSAAYVFSAPDVQAGQEVYMSGEPCENRQQCFGPDPGICENGLCVLPLNTSTTTVPTNTTTTMPPKTTTTVPANTTTTIPTNTTTLAPGNSTTTTTTTATTTTTRKRSTDCPSKAFGITYREVALGMHNNFREYDCYAEQFALNHVRSCDGKPSPPYARPGYSENIHVLKTTATDLLGAIQNAIATFTSELGINGIPSNMVLTPQVFQRTQRTVTRVTKVLWASNRFVACATVPCLGFYFTYCMYKDPVNVVGQSIYPIGAVCSACPTGPKNCNPAIGLCSY